MAYIQELQFKKEKRNHGKERGSKKQEGRKGKKSRGGKRARKKRRGGEERERKKEKEREAVASSHRLHCEPLLPSTAFQCKHCHPICDRVNWFFDVSRKVLIEGGKKKKRKEKEKKRTQIFFSPRTLVYLF